MKRLLLRRARKLRKKLYSFRNRYLDSYFFIHISKTGGSSIEEALKLPMEHMTALEKISEVGYECWRRRFTFTVVRNPWDKVVSHYHYRAQTNQTNLGVNPVPFKEWVRLTYLERDPFFYDKPKMFMPQYDWISGKDGQLLVNHLCRFESINDDFREVCAKLNKTVSLPHAKSSKRGSYREYYDEKTSDIIARHFIQDIVKFGYSF